MKKPTLRGVNPWFRIARSFDKFATIDWAEHPGFAPTKLSISVFNRSNRACFCEPFPSLLGGIIWKSPGTHIKETMGVPLSKKAE